jgi:hypothetical protein
VAPVSVGRAAVIHVRRRPRTSLLIAAVIGALLLAAGAVGAVGAFRPADVVAGTARAGAPTGPSDEDQIVRVLQAISDAYNRKDVQAAEEYLCGRSQMQWNPQLESAWMRYRLRYGALRFTVDTVDVTGRAARVTGTQIYANDSRPHAFTADMGREPQGWKMCSST